MAKVIQSDNAVVDYTTIKALIETVNNLSDTVDKINLGSKTTDPATGKVVTQLVDASLQTFNAGVSQVDVYFKKKFTDKPNVVATLMGGSKATFAYIGTATDLTKSSVRFTLSQASTGSMTIFWVAVGQGSE